MLNKFFYASVCLILTLGNSAALADNDFQVLVNGNRLSWGGDTLGYIQVQDAQTWATICEFDVKRLRDLQNRNRDETACNVPSGKYNVLNHYTRQRINGISVGELSGSYTAPAVEFDSDNNKVQYEPYLALMAESIFSVVEGVETPESLYANIYSPTAAELFWNRAAQPALRYEISIGDSVLGTTQGTSYFLDNLQPGSSYDFTVRARNSQGEFSPQSSINVQTTRRDVLPTNPVSLQTPTGFKAQVYSDTALELFWDKQATGQIFQVLNAKGDPLIQTDGGSYFLSGLTPADSFLFSVVAVGANGDTSEPARIKVDTERRLPESSITIDNADSVLASMIDFANGKPFRDIEQLMTPGVSAVLDASVSFIRNGTTSTGSLTLVEGTGGGLDTINFAGLNGGQFTCDAGGIAEGLSIFGGETSQDYAVSLDECILPQGIFSGKVQTFSGGRSGYSGNGYTNVKFEQLDSSRKYQYDASTRTEIPFRNNGQIDSTTTVNLYTMQAPASGSETRLSEFQSFISSRVGLAFDDDPDSIGLVQSRNALAQITFTVEVSGEALAGTLPAATYTVAVDLKYDGDVEASNPVDLWNSGSIVVTADDGSQLAATPSDTDNDDVFESLRVSVENQSNTLRVENGYLVFCQRAALDACNSSAAQ